MGSSLPCAGQPTLRTACLGAMHLASCISGMLEWGDVNAAHLAVHLLTVVAGIVLQVEAGSRLLSSDSEC